VSVGLRCAGCGWTTAGTAGPDRAGPDRAGPDRAGPWACPAARAGDGVDHVLVAVRDLGGLELASAGSDNPFVRYRHLLASYQRWVARGGSDGGFVELVEQLDAAVAAVDGRGFRITPCAPVELAGFGRVWCKDETGNVAGSHKGRHLMGLMLHLLVAGRAGRRGGTDLPVPLAIASCGNAALAAAIIARAARHRLLVFVPTSASPDVLGRLAELGATVQVCGRDGRPGDPAYRAFRDAVVAGAVPFSCQGPDNGLTIDGGATLGWELAAQLRTASAPPSRLFVQVGGGALASAVVQGLGDGVRLGALRGPPALFAVQTEGGHPLARAWRLLHERVAAGHGPEEAMAHAVAHRDDYMWPWEAEPASVAHGILDDETYDWAAVCRAMLAWGGRPVVVDEDQLRRANREVRDATGIPVDHTGSAGLAGILVEGATGGGVEAGATVAILTGREQGPAPR